MKQVQIDDQNKLWEPSEHDRLCSLHFVTGKPSKDLDHPDYAPSIFHLTPGPVRCKTPKSVDRFERLKKRRRRQILEPNVNSEDEQAAAEALLELLSTTNNKPCKEAQTQTGDQLQMKYEQLQQEHKTLKDEYQRLLNENRELKEHIGKTKFTFTNLSNSQISSLTGLPSLGVFYWILSLVSVLQITWKIMQRGHAVASAHET